MAVARGVGPAGLSPLGLALQAARWRSRRYDLAINFEPDIRTNLALAAAGARRTAGFASGGGGALLDVALDYDARRTRSTTRAGWSRDGDRPRARRAGARGRFASRTLTARRRRGSWPPFAGALTVGIHVSGGRAIKQWPETRFREVAGVSRPRSIGGRSC